MPAIRLASLDQFEVHGLGFVHERGHAGRAQRLAQDHHFLWCWSVDSANGYCGSTAIARCHHIVAWLFYHQRGHAGVQHHR